MKRARRKSAADEPVVCGDDTAEWSSIDGAVAPVETVSVSFLRRFIPPFLVGFLGLGVLFATGMYVVRPRLERHLTKATIDALSARGIKNAQVSYVGRDATIRVPPDRTGDALRSVTGQRAGGLLVIADEALATIPTTRVTSKTVTPIVAAITSDGISLTGVVRSEEDKAAVERAVKSQSPSAVIENKLTIDDAAVESESALWVGKAIGELRRVGSATASVTLGLDGMHLEGSVPSLAIRDSVNAFIAGSGLPVSGALQIVRAPDPTDASSKGDDLFGEDGQTDAAAVQATVTSLLADATIQFRPSSTQLTSEGVAIVAKVAAVLQSSKNVRVTVVGHTDTNGDPAQNLQLSLARAEEVRTELGKLGVDTSLITTLGEGGTKPLVPNDTPANRKKNRRIEILVDSTS